MLFRFSTRLFTRLPFTRLPFTRLPFITVLSVLLGTVLIVTSNCSNELTHDIEVTFPLSAETFGLIEAGCPAAQTWIDADYIGAHLSLAGGIECRLEVKDGEIKGLCPNVLAGTVRPLLFIYDAGAPATSGRTPLSLHVGYVDLRGDQFDEVVTISLDNDGISNMTINEDTTMNALRGSLVGCDEDLGPVNPDGFNAAIEAVAPQANALLTYALGCFYREHWTQLGDPQTGSAPISIDCDSDGSSNIAEMCASTLICPTLTPP